MNYFGVNFNFIEGLHSKIKRFDGLLFSNRFLHLIFLV